MPETVKLKGRVTRVICQRNPDLRVCDTESIPAFAGQFVE